jgi:uncharacterized SAM-binding protein YcdF (DUF218 family)
LFLFLSKLLPLLIYPASLAVILLVAALLMRKHARWRNGLVLAALLVVFLSGNRLVAMASAMSLERQIPPLAIDAQERLDSPLADAIVVLGGSTREGQPPRPAHEVNEAGDRLIYAARLWKAGIAPRILVSGGVVGVQGPAGVPESEMMTELLVVMGVPEEAILQESASQNTYQNALYTKSILDAEDIGQIILVTSAMHMPRSAAIFSRQGIDFLPAPVDFYVSDIEHAHYWTPDPAIQIFNLIPSAEDMTLTSMAMKEWIGLFIYRMRGWA